jgi:hypothetical protein
MSPLRMEECNVEDDVQPLHSLSQEGAEKRKKSRVVGAGDPKIDPSNVSTTSTERADQPSDTTLYERHELYNRPTDRLLSELLDIGDNVHNCGKSAPTP